MKPKPFIGKQVLYCNPWGKIRPAIVVDIVDEETVDLQIFTAGTKDGAWGNKNIQYAPNVKYNDSPGDKPETWNCLTICCMT